MSELYSNSIFWIEVEKIRPNPYQPRKAFNQDRLQDLSDSIRQYGVLQPLVVTRHEVQKQDGGITVEYELIAGERRLRASKLAQISQVPVVIRTGAQDNKLKLELAIIENIQREDINAVDRARAFFRFVDEFNFKHIQIAKKVGKSREYVSNTLRLLSLPDEILHAVSVGDISEGHTRPLLMLKDKPDEQLTLFKEIKLKKLTVRDTEKIARRLAKDKIRKKSREYDPEILRMEETLTETLGTRVQIESREVGGKITIDFFSDEDLKSLLSLMKQKSEEQTKEAIIASEIIEPTPQPLAVEDIDSQTTQEQEYTAPNPDTINQNTAETQPVVSNNQETDSYAINEQNYNQQPQNTYTEPVEPEVQNTYEQPIQPQSQPINITENNQFNTQPQNQAEEYQRPQVPTPSYSNEQEEVSSFTPAPEPQYQNHTNTPEPEPVNTQPHNNPEPEHQNYLQQEEYKEPKVFHPNQHTHQNMNTQTPNDLNMRPTREDEIPPQQYQPNNNTEFTPTPDRHVMPQPPVTEEKNEQESDDLYSIRNFSI